MRQYGPGRPLVFSHIPKTAGTSLRLSLEAALQPQHVFAAGVDGALMTAYDIVSDVGARARSQVILSPDALPADADLVAAHVSPATTMARYPGADHLTILRLPEVRTLSHFLHARSFTEVQLRHWGTARDSLRAGWLPLRQYLEHRPAAPTFDNTITRVLAWPHPNLPQDSFIEDRHDDELVEAALARLEGFGFVDVVEHAGFAEDLGAWLGREVPARRANERSRMPKKRRLDLEAELDAPTRDLLARRSRLDQRVWEHVARRTLVGVDLDGLRRSALDDAVRRYVTSLQQPDPASPLRRTIEWAYEIRVQIDPRRRRPKVR